jgi:hypothetical protein
VKSAVSSVDCLAAMKVALRVDWMAGKWAADSAAKKAVKLGT